MNKIDTPLGIIVWVVREPALNIIVGPLHNDSHTLPIVTCPPLEPHIIADGIIFEIFSFTSWYKPPKW